MFLVPQLALHFLPAQPALSGEHFSAHFLMVFLLDLDDDFIALLALLEQVPLHAGVDVVLGQLGDLDHLVAVPAGSEILALLEAVQVVHIGVPETLLHGAAVLADGHILLPLLPLYHQQLLIDDLLHRHCDHGVKLLALVHHVVFAVE